MQSGELTVIGLGNSRARVPRMFLDQSKLRFLPHAAIAMTKQLDEFLCRSQCNAFGQQLLHFLNNWAGSLFRRRELVDPPLAFTVPAVHPVGQIERAVGS